jgi:hypothetical protein
MNRETGSSGGKKELREHLYILKIEKSISIYFLYSVYWIRRRGFVFKHLYIFYFLRKRFIKIITNMISCLKSRRYKQLSVFTRLEEHLKTRRWNYLTPNHRDNARNKER